MRLAGSRPPCFLVLCCFAALTGSNVNAFPKMRPKDCRLSEGHLKDAGTSTKLLLKEAFSIVRQRQAQDVRRVNRVTTGAMDGISRGHFKFRKAESKAVGSFMCRGSGMLEASIIMRERNISAPFAVSRDLLHEVLKSYNSPVCDRLDDTDNISCSATTPYRSYDGSCNNLAHPNWGQALRPFTRLLCPAYEDEVDIIRGEGRDDERALPNPRLVSLALTELGRPAPSARLSLMLMQWGQFLDHDLVHTPEASVLLGAEEDPVPVPCCDFGKYEGDLFSASIECRAVNVTGDSFFSSFGRDCIRFVRSLPADQGYKFAPREQMNQVSSFLDGSVVYGSSPKKSKQLRLLQRGRLRFSKHPDAYCKGHFLPSSEGACDNAKDVCFQAGDERVNEQVGLTSIHTLWLRVHNRIASQLEAVNKHWDDERIYQETRRIVSALLQQVTYGEFLLVVLGPQVMEHFDLSLQSEGYDDSYDAELNPSSPNVFGAAAFRFGHSLVSDILKAHSWNMSLLSVYNDPSSLMKNGSHPADILQGLVQVPSESLDSYLVPSLTNSLFAKPRRPAGMDLLALNIMRGRDHGIPPYNEWRMACGLPPVGSAGGSHERDALRALRKLYKSPDDIDLFPAALAEKPVLGSILGPTFLCLLAQHFRNLKRGDRFWYEGRGQPRPFTKDQLRVIRESSFASVICSHSSVEEMQPSAFLQSHVPGNSLRPCRSYPTFDPRPWREKSPFKPGNAQSSSIVFPGRNNQEHHAGAGQMGKVTQKDNTHS